MKRGIWQLRNPKGKVEKTCQQKSEVIDQGGALSFHTTPSRFQERNASRLCEVIPRMSF